VQIDKLLKESVLPKKQQIFIYRAKYESVNTPNMMAMQTLCLSFGFMTLTDEAFSKVTFDIQIHCKYTLPTKYCLSEVHVTQLCDADVALCDDLQWLYI
jgi:hypothetical protein